MTNLEEMRFEIRSKEFNKVISELPEGSDEAWALLGQRKFEIADAFVDKDKKAEALDRVLWETDRIFPRSHNAYCETMKLRVELTNKKNQDKLLDLAQLAFMHHRNADFKNYGAVMYDIYQKLSPDNKKAFPYRDTVKTYRKNVITAENKAEKAEIENELARIDFFIDAEETPTAEKLSLIDEAIGLIREKHFGYVKANEYKRDYCNKAVALCRQGGYWPEGAEEYKAQAFDFQRKADNAYLHTPQGNTEANRIKYMEKYRTDKNRE